MLLAANLLGLQCVVQYHLNLTTDITNNCLSVNEPFRVKCKTFQYLVNKIGLPSASAYILKYVVDE